MLTPRARSALSALLLLSSACTSSRPPSQIEGTASAPSLSPAQVALRTFVDAHFEDTFRRFPAMATQAGIHTYDGELRGFSPEDRAAHHAQLKARLAALPQQVDRAALPPLDLADYDILENHLRARILDYEAVRNWERNPNTWLGTASFALFQLVNRDFAPLEERMRSAVSRMKQIPTVFSTAQATLKNSPRLWTEIALMQAQGTRALYADTLPKAFEPVKDAALQEAFKQEQTRCLAAIDGFIRFLREDLLPRSNGDFA
ncbi:DUF885 family protein, partial [Hyalangium sp.]|uniref:DUF885 family protein n=1 Tax=Hyalangium sp. TaxID=2028555 RepID=UPI002D5028A6